MLVPKLFTCVNILPIITGKLRVPWSAVSKQISGYPVPEGEKRPERKLKQWRNIPEKTTSSEETWLKIFNNPSKTKKKYVLLGTKLQTGPIHIGRWWKKHKINFIKHEQQFMAERHEILGCDLAAAHFLVHRSGKVKFLGDDSWIKRDKEQYQLPEKYDPHYRLTHVDASGITFYYEGLENFQNLSKVTWANFSDNPVLDDWSIDKIVANFPNLEYLDISNCPNVTVRGLEAIYKLQHLKTMIITDFTKKPSFELICTMLEECMPNLFIEIREPPENVAKNEKSP